MTTVSTSALDLLLKRYRVRASAESPIALPMSRNDLPALTRELGFTIGAEIGVWRGAYSAAFCEANPSLHMLCVDPWISYPAWLDSKNAMPADQGERLITKAYRDACARLHPLRATMIRKFSTDAARDVPDASLDFVYIDGNHVYDAVREDLSAWIPKVRPGGLVAGHDYRVFRQKPTIHVVAAVNAYTSEHRIAPWFITAGDGTPSFLWVKT